MLCSGLQAALFRGYCFVLEKKVKLNENSMEISDAACYSGLGKEKGCIALYDGKGDGCT